jgi:small subunit ribosomal protein S8
MTTRDWLSSVLNDIISCKNAGKMETVFIPVSKVMIEVLKILKEEGYIEDYQIEEEKFKRVIIKIGRINKCGSIKPRFFVKKNEFEKYIRRYLPSRSLGILILSTNKGIMTHKKAMELGIGGCLMAYCF